MTRPSWQDIDMDDLYLFECAMRGVDSDTEDTDGE